jgi:clan AA aspartic protease
MGVFKQTVLVTNEADRNVFEAGFIKEGDVRKMEIDFLIDTGAYMLCINETIRNQLGLRKKDVQEAILANGDRLTLDIVGPIEVKIHNRRTVAEAMVLPGDNTPLFGSIPLEALDLLVDTRQGQLVVPPERPYIAQTLLL